MTAALAEQVSALEAHLAAKDERILDLEVSLALRCGEASFSLQSRELQQVPAALFSLLRLTRLDLIRNALVVVSRNNAFMQVGRSGVMPITCIIMRNLCLEFAMSRIPRLGIATIRERRSKAWRQHLQRAPT